jgi:hypothetical protein
MEVTNMSSVYRVNRKFSDADVERLNSVGLSLATIAKVLGCHQTTVTLRLKSLGIEPADTRRTFMEDIFVSLTPDHQEWLADQLRGGRTIKGYVRQLLIKEYARQNEKSHEQDV